VAFFFPSAFGSIIQSVETEVQTPFAYWERKRSRLYADDADDIDAKLLKK
jgi:hypothetical protein